MMFWLYSISIQPNMTHHKLSTAASDQSTPVETGSDQAILSQSATDRDISDPASAKVQAVNIDRTDLSHIDHENTTANTQTNRFAFAKKHKILIGISAFLLFLLTIITIIGIQTYLIASQLKAEAFAAKAIAAQGYDQFKAQNLPAAEASVKQLDEKLVAIEQLYNQLGFYNYFPLASRYYQDGQHGLNAGKAGIAAAEKTLAVITPHADVLGFAGEGTFEGGTAEDRLKVILQTLEKVTPELEAVANDLSVMETELAEINPAHYPEQVRGTVVRNYIVMAQDFTTGALTAVTEFKPVLEQLPSIAGATGERRKYLILFQNDNELRPTGGFLTAYAVVNVEDGKVTPEKSDDIYELDKKFSERLPIPEALGRYLTTEKYWNMRDMNTSPDFKTSMDQFFQYYIEVPGEPREIDGIIAVDTEFLTDLLTVLGPVAVPGYGTFSAETDPACDCPQIILALSEIITKPTPYLREDRKGILGPLMREILTKSYGAPKTQWPQLADVGWQSIQGKHLQLYFVNEEHQTAAEVLKAAGRMPTPQDGQDFLAIVNANLGGAKSNLFTDYTVKQIIANPPDNGKLTKTLEITYNNNRRADNCNLEAGLLCLNSTLRDWTRIYVPAGSEIISAQGFTEEPRVYEEAGLSVIDGFFILEPNSSAKVILEYAVPYQNPTEYTLDIWKQGGIKSYEMLMDVTGGEEQVLVEKDVTYQTEF